MNQQCPYCEDLCDINTCVKYQAYLMAQDKDKVNETLKDLGIDINQDKLTTMMKMQKIFAAKFHKVDDLTKEEVDYWMKAYDTCITDEITEVHEHLNLFDQIYDVKNDKYELQKEFIDIWHFLMDEFIVASLDGKTLLELYVKKYTPDLSVDDFIKGFGDGDALRAIFEFETHKVIDSGKMILPTEEGEINHQSVLIASGYVLAGGRKVRHEISWKHWKKPNQEINYHKLYDALVFTFSSLIKCFLVSDLSSESLYDIYITKNIENHYRQVLGY
jgi:dUTPase.